VSNFEIRKLPRMKLSRSGLWLIVACLGLCAVAPARAQEPPAAPAAAQATPAAPAEIAPPHETDRALQPSRPMPRELSPWSMFMAADAFVKGVMFSLAFASLVTWTIFLAKLAELFFAQRRLNAALRRIGRARSLTEAQSVLGKTRGVLAAFVAAALGELRLSEGRLVESGVKERVASHFGEITKTEARAARRGMSLLATIGSTAPFVGLFGTVWGIMNSFIGISKAQTTNLAVVAPGIAEALLATAIGLAAAIPAVMIYNFFNRRTRGYLDLVGRAAGAVGRLLSRDLDRAADLDREGDIAMLARAAE
jgi:biopolymer transport protein ExbB